MKLSKKYRMVKVEPRVLNKSDDVNAFGRIRRSLNEIALRVDSELGEEKTAGRVVFYLERRPKNRQGRLDWNKEVERMLGDCKTRLGGYTPSIIIARNGHELEIKRKRK